ncbi:tandem-95 repeat protein [Novosphingobium sp. G106]|nr:tandem-95 repeat protein [Novosphingobium sp. G106]MBV1688580.1 tandem-95 repeat protein [Novosphingobium sp. G106]
MRITEVAPWASGSSPGGADWFEVTNTGAVAVNLTGWKMDDNSNAFGNAVALSGVTNLAVGESVIFIEAPAGASASQIAALKAAFIDTWFGGHPPVNLQIGTYCGSGVGLSTGGDAVNLYNASGVLQANVSFGASPNGPFPTFDNTAGLNNAAITTVSSVGTNGAFNAAHDGAEVGSPGGDLVLGNNGPLFSSPSAFAVDENQTAAAHLTATDADGDHLTYSISGGLDADLFTIDAETGVISFKAAPNFEAPTDADHDGVYEIDVAVDDGHGLVGEDSIKVTVSNVNEGPLFSSPSTFAADENQTAAAQLAATDADGDHLTYSISGGLDADLFTIDTATGAISFKAAPNFEAPADADHDNVYEIDVAVDDGHGLVGEDSIKVTVGNVNEGPLFTSPSAFAVGENQTAAAQLTATDPDGDHLTYTISGGLDADLFTIDAATGVITFKAAPDFDAPSDANHDNVYEIDVAVDDGHGLVGEDSIKVTVGNLNEAPALTGAQAVLANGTEDLSYVVSAASLLQGFTDADGDTLSVVGLTANHGVVVDNHDGTFTITPAANYNGAVSLSYTVSDGNGGSLAASQGFALAAVNDAPTALALSNSTLPEQRPNNTLVGTLIPTDVDNASGFTYTLLDSAGGRFYLNSATGQVFVGNGSLLDYEASTHYTIDVQVKDAAGATFHQQLTINLTNVVENQSYSGTAAANVFTAPTEDNWTVDGKGGADVITTLSGSDTIFAGAGNDTVHTGGGNDVIYFTGAGGGFDAIDGGAGNDTILVNAVNTVIGLSSISGIETISAGGFAGVKISGTTGDDVLDFSGGDLGRHHLDQRRHGQRHADRQRRRRPHRRRPGHRRPDRRRGQRHLRLHCRGPHQERRCLRRSHHRLRARRPDRPQHHRRQRHPRRQPGLHLHRRSRLHRPGPAADRHGQRPRCHLRQHLGQRQRRVRDHPRQQPCHAGVRLHPLNARSTPKHTHGALPKRSAPFRSLGYEKRKSQAGPSEQESSVVSTLRISRRSA